MKTAHALLLAFAALTEAAPNYTQPYTWKNVRTGGGGGFTPSIVFNPTKKGLAYARTDIGGCYRLNADDSWTPLNDYADATTWNEWGCDALATDSTDPSRLYVAAGMYTNSWDPNNGKILVSTDYGATWSKTPLPFKVGGNMPGRQFGERLAVDPNSNNIIYFGARSGNGLWKSSDFGKSFTKVANFTAVGSFVGDPTDTSGYNSDKQGLDWVTFDPSSGSKGKASTRIFVGTAEVAGTVYLSEDAGATWTLVAGQPTGFLSNHGKVSISELEKALYVTYVNSNNPYGGSDGYVYKYNIVTKQWTLILDDNGSGYGFGGLALDAQKPGTIVVSSFNQWWPDANLFRSTDYGKTWIQAWDFDWSGVQPPVARRFDRDISVAPWVDQVAGDKAVGWMISALAIDPFNSDHILWGTGHTIFGSYNFTNLDKGLKFTQKVLSYGVEETAVLGLISPTSGPPLLSVHGDIGGFRHDNLDIAPQALFSNPYQGTTRSIDYAGRRPNIIVRSYDSAPAAALSNDSGTTWHPHANAGSLSGGATVLSAEGDTVFWSTGNALYYSIREYPFQQVTGVPSATYVIASDKNNNGLFYAAAGADFYVSTDGLATFNKTATLGYVRAIAVNFALAGDVWVATDKGIYHSINQGSTFAKVGPATDSNAIAVGAPAVKGGYPSLYTASTIQGYTGHYRSDDGGYTWALISNEKYGFGSPSGQPYAADPRLYGRVFVGTNGRGIFYGTAVGTSPVPAAANAFGQCGGSTYTGPKLCPHGWTCKRSSDYYSQCL